MRTERGLHHTPERNKQLACFFLKSIEEGLHDLKPKNVSQETWDRNINCAAAFLLGGDTNQIAENHGVRKVYIRPWSRDVISRLWKAHSEEYRLEHPISELFD